MTAPSVLVLYNEPVLPADHPDAGSEHDILDTVNDAYTVLSAAGFATTKLGVSRDPRPLLDALARERPHAVFNLFEGIATQPGTEVSAAALLEWLNVPFTGCPSAALALGRDKVADQARPRRQRDSDARVRARRGAAGSRMGPPVAGDREAGRPRRDASGSSRGASSRHKKIWRRG
jgi:hypothetical protein